MVWSPSAGERVLPVVGCAGSCGASTVALALATVAGGAARVLECCPPAASGLAAASTAELGAGPGGWSEGDRGEVRIQRITSPVTRPEDVPLPQQFRDRAATVVDVGWPLASLVATSCWLTTQLVGSEHAVAVSAATVPGLRRLEAALPLLPPSVTAVAVGPPVRRWPAADLGSRRPGLRRLQEAGRLVVVPHDRPLALHGLGVAPLPEPVLDAARALMGLLTSGPVAEGDR